VAIPRQATTSPARKTIEHGRGFRRLVKWRTGSEGRISYLKRGYGRNRTLLDGKNGAAIWCGHGVLAHNLVKISALARPIPAQPHPGTPPRAPVRTQPSDFFRSK
jgi:transposase, IS5 family